MSKSKFFCSFIGFLVAAQLSLTTASAEDGEKYYLVSHAGIGDPFWVTEFNGARLAAKENNIQLTILAPETPNDIPRQVELLNQAINSGASAIATKLIDRKAYNLSLQKAKKSGIPVIVFNAKPLVVSPTDTPFLSYIGMDDFVAGQNLARKMIASNTFAKGTTILIGSQNSSHEGLSQRYQGLKSIFDQHGYSVELLDIGTDATTIRDVFSKKIPSTEKLGALICLGPLCTHPVGRLLHERELKIPFFSFDITPLTLKLINDDLLLMTVDQQPFMQGYLAVKMMVLTHRYKMTPTDIDTGVGIIDKTNAQAVQNLVAENIR